MSSAILLSSPGIKEADKPKLEGIMSEVRIRARALPLAVEEAAFRVHERADLLSDSMFMDG